MERDILAGSGFSCLPQFGGHFLLTHLAHGGDGSQLAGMGFGLAGFPVIDALGGYAQQLAHVGGAQAQFLAQCSKTTHTEAQRR